MHPGKNYNNVISLNVEINMCFTLLLNFQTNLVKQNNNFPKANEWN